MFALSLPTFDETLAKMHNIAKTKDVVGALRDLEDHNRNRHPQSNSQIMRDMRQVLCELRYLAMQLSQVDILNYSDEARYKMHADANRYNRYYPTIRAVLYDINYNSLLPAQKAAANEFLGQVNLLAASNP